MQVIYNIQSDTFNSNTGVGLGNFDGLHIGHMALINTLISECKLNGLSSVVYTFERHTHFMLGKKSFSSIITTNKQKSKILSSTGLDYLCYQYFDEEYSKMSPDDFIEKILINKLKIKLAVVGFNYRFGHMGKGDAEYLKKCGEKFGFRVIVIPPVRIKNEIVSSTLIREYIKKGKMDRVFHLLGRHFSLCGTVVSGKKLGRTLGFPTANITADPEMCVPARGVYITKTKVKGVWVNGITNVGVAPTIRNENLISIETHFLERDFDEELYGQPIEVCFVSKLRGEKKFENVEALKKQVKEDIVKARKFWDIFN
ncbi:MAG: bifunctional riboflavin kinase/FAD synthetase [Clostridiaceae bacterium]|nr:bifunctional riboflavin kinase/FAD synthetase [Clostridiaceae bacterium]